MNREEQDRLKQTLYLQDQESLDKLDWPGPPCGCTSTEV